MADELVEVQLRLQGQRLFLQQVRQSAGAIRELERETGRFGSSAQIASRRGFLMNQMLFTARRLAYSATLAFGAAAAGAVYMGMKFNMSMETSTVAFTQFLGSEQAASKELDYLYELAAKTPFEFGQLVSATQRFLAFGFSVDEANAYLEVIGDTVAAFGGGAAEIDRAVYAIGQMRAAGRIMGTEIRQLTELGIPAIQILQKQLGLTNEQVARIGETGLKSSVAIPALMAGLREEFGGMSALQAKTMAGQLSTLHDYAAQLFGAITKDLFDKVKGEWLPLMNETAQAMTEAYRRSGPDAAVRTLDMQINAGGKVFAVWTMLKELWRGVASVATNILWPSFKILMTALAPLVPILTLLGKGLQFAGEHGEYLKWVIGLLTIWMTYNAIAAKIETIWMGRQALAMKWSRRWTRLLYIEKAILWGWTTATTWALRAYVFMQGIALVATQRFVLFLGRARVVLATWTAGIWLMNLALLANPITWIVLGVAALLLAIGFLIWKWDEVTQKIQDATQWIKDHWGYVLAIPMFGPIILAITMVVDHIDEMWAKFRNFYNWAQSLNWEDVLPERPGIVPGFVPGFDWSLSDLWGGGIPRMAGGGGVVRGGMSLVGERGPELLSLPAGAMVRPLNDVNFDLGSYARASGGQVVEIRVPITLDRRQIGEANARYQLDQQARK